MKLFYKSLYFHTSTYRLLLLNIFSFFLLTACKPSQANHDPSSDKPNKSGNLTTDNKYSTTHTLEKPEEYVPDNFSLFDEIHGDLNKDGKDDCVLIVKSKDKSQIIFDESNKPIDRNRRGIIVLFNINNHYEVILKNLQCFSSENEDGGVYYPPELSLTINNQNLYIHYAHGRYGFWKYTFKFKDSDFNLIGFDYCEQDGPRIVEETSINFLTHKKLIKTNINEYAVGGDEVFKNSWGTIPSRAFTKLSEIHNFDVLSMYSFTE